MMLIVFTTTPTSEEAEYLAKKLVEARLAACVQVLPLMTSYYMWEGQLQKEPEHLLLIKTLAEKWENVRDFITTNHSYSVPEIVAVDAAKASGPYLDWMKDILK